MIWLLSIVLTFASLADAKPRKSARAPKPTGRYGLKTVGSCATPDAKKKVYIIKQWHLAPTTITKGFPKEKYPQERNQTAIYQMLSAHVKDKKMQMVVAEGCEGEITPEFTPAFNGWDYASLHKVSQTKGYEKILSLVPLKIEARYDDKILTMCGDDEAKIKEGNLRISNLRGWFNFYARLNETYPDDKGKLFADAAAELLKVPKTTATPDLLKQINARIKEELTAFRTLLNERNDGFVKVLQEKDFETAAVVIGGLHADDLKEKVQAAGLGCEVLEPPGYQREAEQLVQDFERVATAGN
ncbi:MAG: hypothetical protein KF799_14490 [Bdellovibrionales bacterium]|nr:hypothetical protein [Bdellovibrionales bacterium]